MKKIVDFTKTVYDLVEECPEIKDIMVELGFKDITSPVALKFMGKMMTIPKGAAVKNIPMDTIIETFEKHGFEVVTPEMKRAAGVHDDVDPRIEKLKTLIKRVSDGEEIESVRKDFVEEFESVSVHDIVGAEQSLIKEGMPQEEVMKLCDLHSALFHGRTEAEIWAAEEKAMHMDEKGHPVSSLKKENRALEQLILSCEKAVEENDTKTVGEFVSRLTAIKTLYSKKEGLLMPVLKKYAVNGPSEVMWGVDDEIKKEIRIIAGKYAEEGSALHERLSAVLTRMKEMIYKEENILFPSALDHFTEEEWIAVYRDMPEMGCVFVDSYDVWDKAETILREKDEDIIAEGWIVTESGKMNLKQFTAVMKLLPLDLTFIDEADINQFYANEGKFFSRPLSSLGRPVYECHPAKVKPIVEQIITSFKEGKQDKVERWIPNPENPVRITYLAVRHPDGSYLGTLEIVQEFKDMKDELTRIWNM